MPSAVPCPPSLIHEEVTAVDVGSAFDGELSSATEAAVNTYGLEEISAAVVYLRSSASAGLSLAATQYFLPSNDPEGTRSIGGTLIIQDENGSISARLAIEES